MTIKKLKKQEKNNYLQYIINGKKYRAYTISDLPSKFGCKNWNKNEPITRDSNPGAFNIVNTNGITGLATAPVIRRLKNIKRLY